MKSTLHWQVGGKTPHPRAPQGIQLPPDVCNWLQKERAEQHLNQMKKRPPELVSETGNPS